MYERKTLIGKDKHIVKIVEQPLIKLVVIQIFIKTKVVIQSLCTVSSKGIHKKNVK